MNKKSIVFLFLLTVALTIIAVSSTSVSAASISDAKLMKKLQANGWSEDANPDSKPLTLGYALQKIREYVESDSNAYVYLYKVNLQSADEILADEKKGPYKYIASTKKQISALKWGVSLDMYFLREFSEKDADGARVSLNGRQQLTREDLMDILSYICVNCYNARIPVVIEKPLPNIYTKGMVFIRQMRYNSLYHGIIMPQPGQRINLSAIATREDLSRALKNLKILSKYRIIKLKKYKTPKKSYTWDQAIKDIESFTAWLEAEGIKYDTDSIGKGFYDINFYESYMMGSLKFRLKFSDSEPEPVWNLDGFRFIIRSSSYKEDGADIWLNALEYDMLGTVKNIIKARRAAK